MTNKLILATFLAMVATAACGDKTDAAGSGSVSASPAGSGAASAAAKKDEPVAAKALTLAQFTTDMPAAACKTMAACKNEEVTAGIGFAMQMMAGFGGMDDPKIAADSKSVAESMKKDGRQTMNAAECTTIMGAVTTLSGFSAEKFQAAIDAKKVEFNGDKAAACVAALSAEPAFCKDEKKVKPDLKFGDIDAMMKPYEKDLEAYLKSCGEALVGKVAAGEPCESNFECAGENVACQDKKCAAKKK
jgi:hypothetical protein